MHVSNSGIACALLEYINGWPDKPVDIHLGEYGGELPALQLLPLSGTVELRRYADGARVLSRPFSVSIRTRASSASGYAIGTLNALADYMCTADLPHLGEDRCALAVELCGAPSRSFANESGFAAYTMPLRLIYAAAPHGY